METFTIIELNEIWTVAWRTIAIFLYAFILLRLSGKRRLAHLTYIDILLIISFGSAVGDVMIYGESTTRFIAAIVALSIVALLVKLFEEFSSHYHGFNLWIEGRARVVIKNGSILYSALEKEDMSPENLMTLLREKGISELKEVKKAFVEPDGELSVVKYNGHNGAGGARE